MRRAVYFDCFSGASGDMLLGALVDCGVTPDAIARELSTLPVSGYRLASERVTRGGIAATKVNVLLDQALQPHRRLSDILALTEASALPPADRQRIAAVFHVLAEAEAKVHGTGTADVVFHEVGALDAIVDVAGTVVALRLLGADECFVSPLAVGAGMTRSMHGTIPIPAPATLELLARASAPTAAASPGERFELLTPTAAAVLTTLGRFERPPMTLERIGYGAGTHDPAERPNVLRAWLGRLAEETAGPRTMLVLETNIDDMNPEIFGWVTERLFESGAVDAWYTPIQMKKNRPAVMLQALCAPDAEAAVVATILRETSTLGVRVREVHRHEAERESIAFQSSLGRVRLKVKRLAGRTAGAAPEFEDCRELAVAHGLPLIDVYRIVASEAAQFLGER